MQEYNESYALLYGTSLCDESKCISRGLSATRFNNSFTCYGDETGEFYPMMCADGYRPEIVDSAPPMFDIFPPGLHSMLLRDKESCKNGEEEISGNDCDSNGSVSLVYFTCCPPVLSEKERLELAPERQCSDPIVVSPNQAEPTNGTDGNETDSRALEPEPDLLCSNGGFPYYMKTSFAPQPIQSYVCCDAPISELSTNFLNDEDYTECVPYHNMLYKERKIMNTLGGIEEISCAGLGSNENGVWVPKPMNIEWEHSYDCDCIPTAFQCCKTGPSMSPFVEDTAFHKTIYPLTITTVFALLLDLVFVSALALPLIIKMVSSRENSSLSLGSSSAHSRQRSSQNTRSSRNSRMSTGSARASIENLQPRYFSYNLYMVYLVLAELVYLSYILLVYGRITMNNTDRYNPYFSSVVVVTDTFYGTSMAIGMSYATINRILNAFMAWEVLLLLKHSHERRRVGPPTLRNVTIKALISYGFGVADLVYSFGLHRARSRALQRSDIPTAMKLLDKANFLHFIIFGLANAALVVICFWIWWRGYLPELPGRTCQARNQNRTSIGAVTRQDQAVRELVWYFVRIILVYYIIWLPAFFSTGECLAKDATYCFITSLLLVIQPIFSTSMAMLKSDVRAYVWELITLSYLRCPTSNKKAENPSTVPTTVQASSDAHSGTEPIPDGAEPIPDEVREQERL